MKFKNRFEEWFDKYPRKQFISKIAYQLVWEAAEKPLLEIIESVIKENRYWFFVQGEHLLSHDLRQKLSKLLEK
jgi:hypothetical protein